MFVLVCFDDACVVVLCSALMVIRCCSMFVFDLSCCFVGLRFWFVVVVLLLC